MSLNESDYARTTWTGTPNNGTGNADQVWNQYWNIGFNNPYSIQTYSDQNANAGYQAGAAEYFKRNPIKVSSNTTTTTSNNIPTNNIPANTVVDNGQNNMQLALNASRNAVNNAYSPLYSQLDSMASQIPTYQAQREQQVDNLYGSQQNEITGARDNSINALNTSRANVASNQAKSVRDLQENMRNMLQAGNIQLGTSGAGDSSAANMYAYALSKQAGRSSADISNQASSQYGQIDSQAQQIRAAADDNFNQLSTWKNTQISTIQQWAQDQLISLNQQKYSATAEQSKAIASNEVNVINSALSNLQQLNKDFSAYKSNINNWALERLASLDDAKAKMSGYGKYSAQDIVGRELQGLNGATSGAIGSYNTLAGYNPWQKQKDEYQNFLNSYGR